MIQKNYLVRKNVSDCNFFRLMQHVYLQKQYTLAIKRIKQEYIY